jgi:hypothetical protein
MMMTYYICVYDDDICMYEDDFVSIEYENTVSSLMYMNRHTDRQTDRQIDR